MFGKNKFKSFVNTVFKKIPISNKFPYWTPKSDTTLVAAEMKENALKTTETDLYGLQTRISSSVPNQHI